MIYCSDSDSLRYTSLSEDGISIVFPCQFDIFLSNIQEPFLVKFAFFDLNLKLDDAKSELFSFEVYGSQLLKKEN